MPDERTTTSWCKLALFSLAPTVGLALFLEFVFTIVGAGEPFVRAPQFCNGAQWLFQPDEHTVARLVPGACYGLDVFNELGCRDDRLDERADIKILCLGDSTTFGWGIRSHTDTYPSILQHLLEHEFGGPLTPGSPLRVEVLNAGAPSYTLYQGMQLYLHHLADIVHWDWVVVSFGWNENPDIELDLDYVLHHPPASSAALWRLHTLLKGSRTYNLLTEAIRPTVRPISPDERMTEARNLFGSELRGLIEACSERATRVCVVPAILKTQGERNEFHDRIPPLNDIARETARLCGAEWVPLVQQAFDASEPPVGWVDTVHFDRQGHAIVAQAVAAAIRRGLVESMRTKRY